MTEKKNGLQGKAEDIAKAGEKNLSEFVDENGPDKRTKDQLADHPDTEFPVGNEPENKALTEDPKS